MAGKCQMKNLLIDGEINLKIMTMDGERLLKNLNLGSFLKQPLQGLALLGSIIVMVFTRNHGMLIDLITTVTNMVGWK